MIEIPRIATEEDLRSGKKEAGWWPHNWGGKPARPIIRCICGKVCHITLHHVHVDGTVTASFFDSKDSSFVENGRTYHHTPGCGWHVWLKLKDYDQGEFLPEVA